MLDVSKQRDQLREFSDYKIRDGIGAMVIYDQSNRDIAFIYKNTGNVQINQDLFLEIPEPNRHKFKEVLLELEMRVRDGK